MKTVLISILEEIGDLLEFKGENQFKVRAFHTAAQSLRDADINLEQADEGTLGAIPGIGKTMQAIIHEYIEHGAVQMHRELTQEIPSGLLEMSRLKGLGPKKARVVYEELGITSMDGLEQAGKENRLATLKGFGAKTQETILHAIQQWNINKNLFRQNRAFADADRLIEHLRAHPAVRRVHLAGDLRRCTETVDRIHILVDTDSLEAVALALDDSVLEHPQYMNKTVHAVSPDGIPVLLEAIGKERFFWHLHRATGSSAYSKEIDALLTERGFQETSETLLQAGHPVLLESEEEIFRLLDLPFLPPETREGMGEIQLALQKKFPDLIEAQDMRGMLHVHTSWSDGHDSVREMALAAKELGYTYIAICDHSKSAVYANGLSEERVLAQHDEIDALNEEGLGILILKGIESDILADGSLDYPDHILERFDLIVASVHSQFGMTREAMTERIVRALTNPYTTILGHPTGRLLLTREAYAVDVSAVLEAAREYKKIIEINANPYRLDLDWRFVRHGREMGIRFAINPDAHKTDELPFVRFGVGIARKGLLSAYDIVNTLTLEQFQRRILQKRPGNKI